MYGNSWRCGFRLLRFCRSSPLVSSNSTNNKSWWIANHDQFPFQSHCVWLACRYLTKTTTKMRLHTRLALIWDILTMKIAMRLGSDVWNQYSRGNNTVFRLFAFDVEWSLSEKIVLGFCSITDLWNVCTIPFITNRSPRTSVELWFPRNISYVRTTKTSTDWSSRCINSFSLPWFLSHRRLNFNNRPLTTAMTSRQWWNVRTWSQSESRFNYPYPNIKKQ